jgi:DNA-binding winged helix-turn-helix (wHTH) protein
MMLEEKTTDENSGDAWRAMADGSSATRAPEPTWRFGPFNLLACGTLLEDGAIVPLTPTGERVLRLLVEAQGRRVSKDEIANGAWDSEAISDASIARAIHTLRRRLGDGRQGIRYILTSYGRGYQLAVPSWRTETRRGDVRGVRQERNVDHRMSRARPLADLSPPWTVP